MKQKRKKNIIQILGLVTIIILARYKILANESNEITEKMTIKDGKLGDCTGNLDCFTTSLEINLNDLNNVDEFFKSCKTKKSEENYRYFVCETKVFNFAEDVEILYLKEKDLLHYRSSSRVPESILCDNKARFLELTLYLQSKS